MRVLVSKKSLAETLARVERIVPDRSSNPGLSLLRIDVERDSIELSGSNMDVDIRAHVGADSPSSGKYAVAANMFGQIVRALPGDDATLEFTDNELQVSSGSFTTRLQLTSPDSAPHLAFPSELKGSIEAAELAQALAAVRYAAAVADFQAVFRGVKLELRDTHTRAVATDGFRLAYYHMETVTGLDADVIVPARSIDELLRALGDGEVKLRLDEGQLSVAHGAYALNLKLMDGTFPDYERVIPREFPVSITLEAARLRDAVARVALMADKSANNRVDLFIRDGQLQINAEGGFGRSQEALDVMQEGTESEIQVAYNSRYLVDALVPVEGKAQLRFSGRDASPSVILNVEDPSYLGMVVPLKTS